MSKLYSLLYAAVIGIVAFLLIALFLPYQAEWGRRVSANFITGLMPGVTDPFISSWALAALVFTLVFAVAALVLLIVIRRTHGNSLLAICASMLNVGPSIWFGIHMHRVFIGPLEYGPIKLAAIAPSAINVSYFVWTIVLPGVGYLALCMLALVMRPRTSTVLFMFSAVASMVPIAEIGYVWLSWAGSSSWQPNLLRDNAMIVWFWVEFVDVLILATAYMLATRSAVVEPGVAGTH